MRQINASITIDQLLYREDIAGSRAHARMLMKVGLLKAEELADILRGLDQVEQEFAEGRVPLDPALEDIHMHVETRLADIIGAVAGKLHTGRSRNDQVATDFRLWLRQAIDQVAELLRILRKALLEKASLETETLMPGFTHLQPAQPITFAHHLLAYCEMYERDQGRLLDCRQRLNESPLGAAALAGTGLPNDRHMTAAELGFARPMRNSVDAVSARDFALEYLSSLSILALHLSRLAEEIVLWSSEQFGFVHLSDGFTTGSSIMPQKRNPDAAELVRGKSGTFVGAFTQLAMMIKALPLAYGKDMQEDKAPVFRASEDMILCLQAMTGMIRDMAIDREKMAQAATHGYLTATDLADWLVKHLSIPFRQAHHIAGRAVKLAEQKHCRLNELSLMDLQSIEPKLNADALKVLDEKMALNQRVSWGGTAPALVKKAIGEAMERLG